MNNQQQLSLDEQFMDEAAQAQIEAAELHMQANTAFNESEGQVKRGRGRPAGAKNKVQNTKIEVVREAKQRGRPKGSVKTVKPEATVFQFDTPVTDAISLPTGVNVPF